MPHFSKPHLQTDQLRFVPFFPSLIFSLCFLSLKSLPVATGFPAGQTHLKTRLEEIRLAVEDGATEIDVVINRTLVLTGQWEGRCRSLLPGSPSPSWWIMGRSERNTAGLRNQVPGHKSMVRGTWLKVSLSISL
jgi:hypothetical protein